MPPVTDPRRVRAVPLSGGHIPSRTCPSGRRPVVLLVVLVNVGVVTYGAGRVRSQTPRRASYVRSAGVCVAALADRANCCPPSLHFLEREHSARRGFLDLGRMGRTAGHGGKPRPDEATELLTRTEAGGLFVVQN